MRALRPIALVALGAACAAACKSRGDDPPGDGDLPDLPSASQIADARLRLQVALAGADEIREVLERVGLLPSYTCGEPRGTFAGDVVGAMQARYGCAAVTLDTGDPARDVVTVAFPAGGCELGGALFAGSMVARISGGDDTFALELDPRSLTIGGDGIAALGGSVLTGNVRVVIDAHDAVTIPIPAV